MEHTESWLLGEPNLQDVMLDPIVQLVMRGDGLTPEMVWPFLRATSARLREEPGSVEEAAEVARAVELLLEPLRGVRRPP